MRKIRVLSCLAAVVALMAFLPAGASAATSGRSQYCAPSPGGLCGSVTAHLIGDGLNQLTGQTSITDRNPYCGVVYIPNEQGWVRVWWNDGYSHYYGKVNGYCGAVPQTANFTTPVRSGTYPHYFQFLASPNRVVNGNYSACRLGKKVTVE